MSDIYFCLSAVISALFIFFTYRYRYKFGFLLPSTIFMLMWCGAILSSIVVQNNTELNEYAMSYDGVGEYIFSFISCSCIGFLLARFCSNVSKRKRVINLKWIAFLSSRLKFFLYISFVLGIIRILIIIKTFGWDSLYDYRQNVFLLGKMEQAGAWYYVSQISSYIYILASFSVVLVAIKQAQTTFNVKEMSRYFLLYSAQALSIGGRMFVIDFISCFFFSFFIIRGRKAKLLSFKESTTLTASIFILIGIVMILGVIRNNRDEKVKNEDYLTKLLYIQDGIIYTTATFTLAPVNSYSLDYGKNITSFDRENTSFEKFKNSSQMEIYLPFVTGVIAPLYFDFGYIGSLVAWLIICFFFEFISIKALNISTIWSLLLIFIFIRYMYDTPLMISGGRGLFRYLFILLLFYLFRNRLKYEFTTIIEKSRRL